MPHPDLDTLANAAVPFAKQMIARHREFYPFALSVTSGGEVRPCAVMESRERPPALQVIDSLVRTLKQEVAAGRVRATAVCCDVLFTPPGTGDKTDAIRLIVEHRDGDSFVAHVPYRRRLFRGVTLGEMTVQPCQPLVFTR